MCGAYKMGLSRNKTLSRSESPDPGDETECSIVGDLSQQAHSRVKELYYYYRLWVYHWLKPFVTCKHCKKEHHVSRTKCAESKPSGLIL